MQTREQNGSSANKILVGSGANMKQLTKASIGLAGAARDFTNAIRQISVAAVDVMTCIDWKALGATLAQEAETEPDDNPVRFIGIRKRGWKRGRRKYRC